MRTPETVPDYDLAPPKADALVESLRAFGYTTPAAVADLVDNSISAGARTVWIDCYWAGSATWIRVVDDGAGMSVEELVDAMRAGSQNPRLPRAPSDLGRFGLGLKTASFSQCRLLTVASKRVGSGVATRRWDLDLVGTSCEWRLLRVVDEATSDLLRMKAPSGTVVLWQRLDRVVGDSAVNDARALGRFQKLEEEIEHHLAATFHRFLGTGAISLYVNGNRLQAWDPFMSSHPATQPLPDEVLWVDGQEIIVKPYVLPHQSKLTQDEHRGAAGAGGWNAQQGFYVYRNRRLIVAGGWLGLGLQKEEHSKLARIRVDLPNSLDEQWQVDVRKATARPPGPIRDDLRRIARATRERAVEVYRFRGKAIARSSTAGTAFVWTRELGRGEKIHYRLNRDHPAVAELVNGTVRSRRVAAIRLIEETVPVPLIAIDHAENAGQQAAPLEGSTPAEIEELLLTVRDRLLASGLSAAQTSQVLMATEPFDSYPELVQAATGSIGEPRREGAP